MNKNGGIWFSWEELIGATGGQWIGTDPGAIAERGVSRISTDSRKALNNGLFIALTGPNFDGHDFLPDAVSKKAQAVCVQKTTETQNRILISNKIPCLLVPSTIKALGKLASVHRRKFPDIDLIAVTGSSGKTSTKEIIGAILREHFGNSVLITQKNTNNQIGVPLNLLRLDANHKAGVLELGTNSPGEILPLAEMVFPRISVITNIGPVHLQGLKTIEGVKREKCQIFSFLSRDEQFAVIPYTLGKDPVVKSKIKGATILTFGLEKEADFRVEYLGGDFDGSTFLLYRRKNPDNPIQIQWRGTGKYHALNAAAALAACNFLKVSDESFCRALRSLQLPEMRMEVKWKNDIRWINDAYNANPESMNAFIDWLAEIPPSRFNGSRCYVILGDMFELGEKEQFYHKQLLSGSLRRLPEMILLPVGDKMTYAAAPLGIQSFTHKEGVKNWLLPRLNPGDSVALKGSRGMALEEIIPLTG